MSHPCQICAVWSLIIVILGVIIEFLVRLSGAFIQLNSRSMECCDNNAINPDFRALSSSFDRKLFGQHLASEYVPKALESHYTDENPKKALVLSFHGSTGTGKNFVSTMIVNNIYQQGTRSKFVHQYYPSLHFKDIKKLREYKKFLKNEVESCVRSCPRCMFIFDEIDEMYRGLLDVIHPYIDFHEAVDGIDNRKSTFIFLSNDHGEKFVMNQFAELEEKGLQREEVQLDDLEGTVVNAAFKKYTGGLSKCSLITRNQITAFIPFLPLVREHVESCIREEIRNRNGIPTTDIIDKIIRELPWISKDKQLYSVSGCKWVSDKVRLYFS